MSHDIIVVNQHVLIVIVVQHSWVSLHQILVVVLVVHHQFVSKVTSEVLLLLLVGIIVSILLFVELLFLLLLFLIDLGHCLLSLKVSVESDELLAHLSNHGDLLLQELVQARHILLYVRPRLINLIEQSHFLFD
jgi:hypothetical protein